MTPAGCSRQGGIRCLLVCRNVELAQAVFIGDEGDVFAVFAERELFDVPWDAGGEVVRRHGGEVEVRQALEVGVAVGGEIDSFAVFAEDGGP